MQTCLEEHVGLIIFIMDYWNLLSCKAYLGYMNLSSMLSVCKECGISKQYNIEALVLLKVAVY